LASVARPDQLPDPDDLFRGFMMRRVHRGTGIEAAAHMKIEIK